MNDPERAPDATIDDGDAPAIEFVAAFPSPNSLSPAEQVGPYPLHLEFPSVDSFFRLLARNSTRLTAAFLDTLLRQVRLAVREETSTRSTKSLPTFLCEQLSVEQVAALLHKTTGTVREWIKSGDLKASRVGPEGRARIYSVARADLEEFLERRRVNPVLHDLDVQADEILRSLKGE